MTTTTGTTGATRPPRLETWHLALLLAGPVLLAAVGSYHPSPLSADSAERWRVLHLVMLPLFPLLGVTIWLLVRQVRGGTDGLLALGARVGGYVYACFYTALDVLAGIANGAVVQYGADTGTDVDGPKAVVFGEGNDVALVGNWAMLVACVLVGMVYVRRVGWIALPGTAVLLISSWSFFDSHVYPWRGVVTMLGFGLGALLLALPLLRDQRRVDTRAQRVEGAA